MKTAFEILFFVVLVAGSTAAASAQVASEPPPPGVHEGWDGLSMRPFGEPPEGNQSGQWITVERRERIAVITFEPERRVRWSIRWGPHGPIEKHVEVDGEQLATVHYEYDAAGHLARKVAARVGVAAVVYEYRVDGTGRVVARRAQLTGATVGPAVHPRTALVIEELRVTYDRNRTIVRTSWNGAEVRRDVLDPAGRPLRVEWPPGEPHRVGLSLRYARARDGRLVGVERALGARRSPTDPSRPDGSITAVHLATVFRLPASRAELRLLLGAPITTRDHGRGVAREITDDWAQGCNAPSAIVFDGAETPRSTHSPCVCGFCVAAEVAVDSDSTLVEGTDLHFTDGPWVRLDDTVDVTVDHGLITPDGIVPAGELRAGDAVIGADGSPRVLRSVRVLGSMQRLGRNVHTSAGTFDAGGFRFATETPRACPP